MNQLPTTSKLVPLPAHQKATLPHTWTRRDCTFSRLITLPKLRLMSSQYSGEHGRAAPAVLDLQNQQNRTYNPTPGRHTAAAQTTELFIRKKLFTNACNNIAPRAVPPPVQRNRNGAAGGAAKGGTRGNTPAPATATNQTANRPRRQPGGASAAINSPPIGRGGPAAPDAS